MGSSKLRQIGGLWALALLGSALLVAAGRRWPDPLPPRLELVWSLVVLPPLLLGVWLLVGWRLPVTAGGADGGGADDGAADGRESLRGTESVPKEPPFPQER
jgi:hypothetical protein